MTRRESPASTPTHRLPPDADPASAAPDPVHRQISRQRRSSAPGSPRTAGLWPGQNHDQKYNAPRRRPRCKLPKNESSMTCCDAPRRDSNAPISVGNGSWRLRVKALGNSKCRASAANSSEWMRSMSWEKKAPRANPIFCCHAHRPFRQQIENKPIKSKAYRSTFTLTSVD